MINRRKLGMIVASGALVVMTGFASLAVIPQTTLAASPSAAVDGARLPGRGGPQDDTFLAQALGITVEDLDKAQETARIAGIDQALKDGLITQAQADALKENQRFGGRGGLDFFMRGSEIDHQSLLANALGITVEQLEAAVKAAADARLAQAVTDGKITQEQVDLMKARQALQTYIQEKGFYAEAVKQAVADGVITQAQADAILSQTGPGMRPFGGKGDFGGRGGRGGLPGLQSGTQQQPQSAPAQSSGARAL